MNELGKDGVFFGGGTSLLVEQVIAVVVVLAFSLVVSGVIGVVLKPALPVYMRSNTILNLSVPLLGAPISVSDLPSADTV